jgi:hypothetical protein
MSTLVQSPARPALRLLGRRPCPVPAVPALPVARGQTALSERLDHWLGALPEPRNRLGATIRV